MTAPCPRVRRPPRPQSSLRVGAPAIQLTKYLAGDGMPRGWACAHQFHGPLSHKLPHGVRAADLAPPPSPLGELSPRRWRESSPSFIVAGARSASSSHSASRATAAAEGGEPPVSPTADGLVYASRSSSFRKMPCGSPSGSFKSSGGEGSPRDGRSPRRSQQQQVDTPPPGHGSFRCMLNSPSDNAARLRSQRPAGSTPFAVLTLAEALPDAALFVPDGEPPARPRRGRNKKEWASPLASV
jgi:hypothetical protein